MSNTHTISHLGGIVEALPTIFGFMPVESVVVLTTHGARNRMGFRMRLDLADFTHDPTGAAQMLASHVRTHREPDGGVIVLVVTGSADQGTAAIDALADALDCAIMAGGVAHGGIVRSWTTGETYDYTDPHTSIASTMAVAEGQRLMHTREEIEASLMPQHTAAPVGQGPTDAHLALAALNERCPLTDEARVALTRSAAEQGTRDELLTCAEMSHPGQHAAVWIKVARVAHRDDAGPVYAVAGYAAYLSGDGARALMLLETALRLTPDHTLAQLVYATVNAGISPEQFRTITNA